MAKKKGKKGKKDKGPTGPVPTTTVQIIQDRTKMLCPRMGDIYERNEQVEMILEVDSSIFHRKGYAYRFSRRTWRSGVS